MSTKGKSFSLARSDMRLAYILLAPALIYLLCVMLLPFLWAIYISFTDKKIGAPETFIGLGNYIALLRDKRFLQSVQNTFVFTASAVFFKVVLGVIMALVLNSAIKARSLFRALLILPWTIPTVVSALSWKWIYSGGAGGVLNHILKLLGLIERDVIWLVDEAMFSVVLMNVWRGAPFIAISVLAGLQTLPADLPEAASIDGANVLQRFVHITLPGIRSVTALAALVTSIWTVNEFTLIWLMTKGGPADRTQVISTYSYIVGFTSFDLGKAISVSVLFMPFMFLLVNMATRQTLQTE